MKTTKETGKVRLAKKSMWFAKLPVSPNQRKALEEQGFKLVSVKNIPYRNFIDDADGRIAAKALKVVEDRVNKYKIRHVFVKGDNIDMEFVDKLHRMGLHVYLCHDGTRAVKPFTKYRKYAYNGNKKPAVAAASEKEEVADSKPEATTNLKPIVWFGSQFAPAEHRKKLAEQGYKIVGEVTSVGIFRELMHFAISEDTALIKLRALCEVLGTKELIHATQDYGNLIDLLQLSGHIVRVMNFEDAIKTLKESKKTVKPAIWFGREYPTEHDRIRVDRLGMKLVAESSTVSLFNQMIEGKVSEEYAVEQACRLAKFNNVKDVFFMTSSFTRHVSTFLNSGLDVHYNNITGSTLYASQQEAPQLPVVEEKSCIVLKAMWVGYVMPGYQDTFRIGSIDYNLVETMIIPDILRVYEPKTQAAWLDLVKHYARMNKVDVIYTDNGNAFTGISRTQTGANPIPVYRVGEFRTWQPIGYLDIEGCIDSASIAHTIKPTVSKSAPPAGLESINSALYEKFSKLNAELNSMLQDMVKTDEFTSEQSEKLLKAAADLNKTVKIRDEIDKLASHL